MRFKTSRLCFHELLIDGTAPCSIILISPLIDIKSECFHPQARALLVGLLRPSGAANIVRSGPVRSTHDLAHLDIVWHSVVRGMWIANTLGVSLSIDIRSTGSFFLKRLNDSAPVTDI